MQSVLRRNRRLEVRAVFAFALLGSLTMAGVTAAFAQDSVVTWSPESIDVTLRPGGNRVISASFTTTRTLHDVIVVVPPELGEVLSVEPLDFNRVQSGQMMGVRFLLTPSGAASTEGEVVLHRKTLDGSKPIPRAASLPFMIEETLESIEFFERDGLYSIIIPNNLTAVYHRATNVLRFNDIGDNDIDAGGIYISFEANPASLFIEEFYDGEPGVDYFGLSGDNVLPVTIDGIAATKFISSASLGGLVVVVVPIGEGFIVIKGQEFPDSSLSQLLQSFRVGF